ncbi:MAG TPA: T9SS type A sorting domain-containing protein [Bacteroidales bacterium]
MKKKMMNKKPIICLLIIIIGISLQSKSQSIEVSGIISENTNWEADTIKIVGDISIENEVLLTISPGVYIEAQGYYKIDVGGQIKAIGRPNDTITFTVKDTTGFWLDTLSLAGGWPGIYIVGQIGSNDSSIFQYCKIQYGKNYDEYGGDINGGALYVYNHGFLRINHCLFNNNMVICYDYGVDGPFGGAVYCENVNKVVIDSNSFIRNRSFDFSGAIRIDDNCISTKITNNTFIYNAGFHWTELPPPWYSGVGGGGAAISTSDLVYSPEISNNYCFNNKGLNGIIYTSNLHARVFNNIICNNWGSGIADGHQLSTSKIFNNTIVNNKTWYGGILIWSKAEVYNNICWNNVFYPGVEVDQIYIDEANPTLKYNCVQYGDGGPGAVFNEPEFVEPTDGLGTGFDGASADWSLQNWSPCVNAGTPDTSFLTIPEYDILGNIRIFGNRIDMGAYENQEVWTSSNEIAFLEEGISVFPNPATTAITIKINTPCNQEYLTVLISDALGKEIFKKQIKCQEQLLQINVTNWKSGLYLVGVFSPNGIVSRTKLVVK